MRYFKLIISALTMLVVSASMYAMAASIPLMIPYQGAIVVYQSTDDVIGTKLNGDGQFKFAIVSQGCEDTDNVTPCTAYWSNDGSKTDGSEPTNYISIPVSNGNFAVKLGDISIDNKSGDAIVSKMQAIPGSVFDNSTTYLRVWFNDGEKGFQQLSPDRQLVSVSYAYRADRAYMADAVIGEGVVSSTQIAAGAVDTPQIKDGAVNSTKIANGTIAIDDLSFDTATQAELDTHKASSDHDGRYFTEAELSAPGTINNPENPVDWTKLKGVPDDFKDGVDNVGSGPASDVVCVGCVDSTDIAAGGVGNSDIATDAVGTAQIVNNAVTTAKIAAGAVGTTQIATDAITTEKILNGQVTAAKINRTGLDADTLDGKHASDLGDIIAVYAGTGLTGGGTSGDVTIGISPGGVGYDQVSFDYAGGTSKGGPASDLACATGCVSESELTFSGIKPSNRVVVAKKGGDFQTITEALEKITPSEKEPYVIDVMPGTYFENITMKDYVHLRGAGQEVTTINATNTTSDVITIANIKKAAISGLTITGGRNGIYSENSFFTVTGNTLKGNASDGIHSYSSSPTITGNIISGNSFIGIANYITSSPTITGNTITENNTGIQNSDNSLPLIIHNQINKNVKIDILNKSSNSPYISFNIFDLIDGITWVGTYNLNSSGKPVP